MPTLCGRPTTPVTIPCRDCAWSCLNDKDRLYACAQVIAENIKNGGDLNAMVPGQKVLCRMSLCTRHLSCICLAQ